jgi:hypothetical protein
MKRIDLVLCALLLMSCAASAQTVSENSCAFIDNSRDSFFIKFEKVEAIADLSGKKVRSAILRITNNLTCSIGLQTSDVEHFLVRSPAGLNGQLAHQRKEIIDGEFVPELEFYREFRIDDDFHGRTNNGGDVRASIILKGGNSALFAVPFDSFKHKRSVVVPVEFEWESNRGKVAFTGDTYHLVWFRYRELPESWLKEIGL